MNVQIDLGNLAVGMATAFIAFVTLHLSKRTIQNQNEHKIAEFRREWIEDLRSHVASFVEAATEKARVIIFTSNPDGEDRLPPFDYRIVAEIDSRMMREHSYIRMLLNETEANHKQLLDQMNTCICAEHQNDIAPPEVARLAKVILGEEWKRLKSEIRKTGAD